MKKDISVLKHASLQEPWILQTDKIFNHFSVFRTGFDESPMSEHDEVRSNFRSDFFSVIQVTAGAVSVRINHADLTIGSGEIFISVPNSIKKLLDVTKDCRLEGLNFTADFLREIHWTESNAALVDFFSARFLPKWTVGEEDSALFSRLIGELQHRADSVTTHTYGRELLGTGFMTFLYEIAEIGKKSTMISPPAYGRKEDLAMRFIRLGREHHREERMLAFYAQHLFVTSKYLSETVKEVTGKTAGEILDEMNVSDARVLLENPELSIAEIAYRLNFSSPAFFSKFFKRHGGVSPRKYRQEVHR